jgi:DNA-binding MarR family transcriptional regulator
METARIEPAGKGTLRTKPREDAASEEVLILLRRLIRAVDLHSKKLVRETGLTTPQVVVLQAIRDSGEVTTGRISSAVSLSQATVTTIVDRLEDRGLIERYRSTIDRRVVHLRLTAAGRSALRKAPPLLHERFRRSYASLNPARQRAILNALRDVAEMMGANSLDAAPLLHVSAPASAGPRRRKNAG